ncbi:amino acid transporter AVT3B isoform X1 [Strongylocentrotus purpuratus]|uniref:Amino acid transporter transmembrane domain-containing protein n=1 Tax=Strongylocentrotus purpuratus TaxID=7668 RepID=A0A7M7NHM7_STRPU|nr:amino acid transporter AVT3B isoform X1 [Strongylocentrotus purpuratus]
MHGEHATSSSVKIFANIFISFVGAGVLGLPYAFKEAGIWEGIIIMLFVAIVSMKAMLLLIDCKYKLEERKEVRKLFKVSPIPRPDAEKGDEGGDKEEMETLMNGTSEEGVVKSGESNGEVHVLSGTKTSKIEVKKSRRFHCSAVKKYHVENEHLKELNYGDLAYYALGTKGRLIVEMSIVISQTGFCCSYLIFISSNLAALFQHLTMYHYIVFMLPGCCALSLLRHLNKLALFSLMADFANIFAYTVVFWFDFEHIHNVPIHPKTMSLEGFPFFLVIAFYCYEGAGMILDLESSVAMDKRDKFRSIFKMAIISMTGLFIGFGACGYLSFGPETMNIITLNLPDGVLPHAVQALLSFSLYFTYPVMMFPVIRILEKRLLTDPNNEVIKANLLRLGMVLLTAVVVVLIPNFTTLMALVGATCCTLLAFILPGLIHWRIFQESRSCLAKVLDVLLIFMGCIATVLGTIDALKRLFPSLDPNHTVVDTGI